MELLLRGHRDNLGAVSTTAVQALPRGPTSNSQLPPATSAMSTSASGCPADVW